MGAALSGLPVKHRLMVVELQQRGGNLLCFRHAFVRGIEARLLVCALGVRHVSRPADISIAHMESSCADIYVITLTPLRSAGEGHNVAQTGFRAIFWGDRAYTIRTVLEA